MIGNKLNSTIAFVLFSIIVFFPTYIGGLSLHAGQKFLYLLFPLFIILFLIGRRKVEIPTISVVLFILFVFFLITVISKVEFINIQIALAHFRYLAYFFVFTVSYNIARRFKVTLGELRGALICLVSIILLFVIAQLLLPELIMKFGITNREGIGRLGLRIGGPFVWSYSYGFALMPIFYMIYFSLVKGDANLNLILLLGLILLTVLAGQSKAAYLAYVAAFIFFIPMSYRYGNKKHASIFLLSLLLIVLALGVYVAANLEEFGNIHRFIVALSSEGADASTQTRLNQLFYIKKTLDENILLGYPINYIIIENGYGYYLYNYGVVGLLCYLSLLCFLFLSAYKAVHLAHKNCNLTNNDKTVTLGYLAFVIGAIVFSLANSPLDGHKVAYFFWTFSGLFWGSFKNQSQ
ncbi:O-antigen ligase family protein [Pseudoalteromonas sp. 2CM28B]|uniref:O-antigen ligase family protein n=1 Tax=Pseudoalteromonas sp. 2CM28B TaxID=2929851 RepID=UPI0020C0FAE6|nr:O-antigen ligase family protein [Pseudoalteromonas sp. 2CM28B]MCK8137044.1 O-antigen ligase family protein [Pseudoalteromonas sp. 2CM28B]